MSNVKGQMSNVALIPTDKRIIKNSKPIAQGFFNVNTRIQEHLNTFIHMKGTKLYSILKSTCPRCHEEKMFKSSIYDLRQMTKMHKRCAHCGLKYDREPSFFTGAAYVSYAFTVALIIIVFVASKLLFDVVNVDYQIILIAAIGILLAPLNFRLSRNIWINLFVKYEPHKRSRRVEQKDEGLKRG